MTSEAKECPCGGMNSDCDSCGGTGKIQPADAHAHLPVTRSQKRDLGEQRQRCPKCDRIFYSLDALQEHVRQIHDAWRGAPLDLRRGAKRRGMTKGKRPKPARSAKPVPAPRVPQSPPKAPARRPVPAPAKQVSHAPAKPALPLTPPPVAKPGIFQCPICAHRYPERAGLLWHLQTTPECAKVLRQVLGHDKRMGYGHAEMSPIGSPGR